jgi:hypothetical protein
MEVDEDFREKSELGGKESVGEGEGKGGSEAALTVKSVGACLFNRLGFLGVL